jgi:hypothetical protein
MRYVMALAMILVTSSALSQSQKKAPDLATRIQMYEQIAYMTDRDFAELTPGEQKALVCVKIGEKIDIQLEYERHGSHGVYNMDALRHAGPEYCRPYLMSIH